MGAIAGQDGVTRKRRRSTSRAKSILVEPRKKWGGSCPDKLRKAICKRKGRRGRGDSQLGMTSWNQCTGTAALGVLKQQ